MNKVALVSLALSFPASAEEVRQNSTWIDNLAAAQYGEEMRMLGSYLCSYNRNAGVALSRACLTPPPAGTAILLPPERVLNCAMLKDAGETCPPVSASERASTLFSTLPTEYQACVVAMRTSHPEWEFAYTVMLAKSLHTERVNMDSKKLEKMCRDPDAWSYDHMRPLPLDRAVMKEDGQIDYLETRRFESWSEGRATDGQGRPVH